MFTLFLYVFVAISFLLGALILSYAAFVSRKRQRWSHIPSPPMPSFFKGHADEFLWIREQDLPVGQLFLEWCTQYGKVLVVWFWHNPVLLVADSDAIKEILVVKNLPKEPNSYKNISCLYGQRYLGGSLVTNLDDESWKKRREIMNPAFHRKSLKDLMGAFNSTANRLMEHLSTMADGKTEVCMLDEFARAAIDVICKVAFGMDVDAIAGKDTKFTGAVSLSFEGADKAAFDLFHKFRVSQYPYQRRVASAIQFLRETGKKVIDVRKSIIRRKEYVPNDILQRIIYQEEKIPGLGIEDMIDDFVIFFIAGHETTASLMAFSVLELGDHPEIEESLVDEVFDVLGENQNVAFDDLGKMHQLGLVLKEPLRHHPPATSTLRKAEKGMEIGGYKIPDEVPVWLNTYVSSHLPDYWEKPDEFNPYRFDDEELLKRSHYTYFPFALGPRNCIGQNFALIEAKVILSRFLQTFKFSLVPGQSRKVRRSVTVRPEDGVMCTLTKR